MIDYLYGLTEMAEALISRPQSLDYPTRTRIERGLFITAKHIAQSYLGQNISSLSLQARDRIDRSAKGTSASEEIRELVLQAFELQAALSRLTSSDPYVAYDHLDEAIPGRKQAIAMFARRVKRYSAQSAALLARKPM